VHTAYDPAPHNHSQHNQCRRPYAVIHGLVLLMMGITMPETCGDRSLIINIGLVAFCWVPSLYPIFNLRLISGSRREVAVNLSFLGHYAASSGNFLPPFRDNLSGLIFRVQESIRKPTLFPTYILRFGATGFLLDY